MNTDRIALFLAMAASAICASGAAAQPAVRPAAAAITWDAIQPIVTPLTYRDMIIAKCRMKEASPLKPFMAELKTAGASRKLIARAKAETARLRKLESRTPAEYVCTAELFDSTEKNAADAQKAWADLKTRKP
jgi:hypothetical protein